MIFLTVLIVIVAILLILVVLIQNPKGGLDAAFSTNNQVMGVRKTTDFIEKATWGLCILLVVLSISSTVMFSSSAAGDTSTQESKMQENIDNMVVPAPAPQPGTPAPAPNN